MKNIVIRALSGSIFVALIFFSVLYCDTLPAFFLTVFAAILAISINEFLTLASKPSGVPSCVRVIDILGGLSVFLAFYIAAMHNRDGLQPEALIGPIIYFVARIIMQLYLPRENAIKCIATSLLAVAYIAMPLGLLSTIISISQPRVLIGIFIMIWLNDTGAFLVGSATGKHKLFERISPHKTWEGFAGGVAASVLASIAMYELFNDFFGIPSLGLWLGLSIIVPLAATYGDLAESLLKRTAGVKDAGHIIPGHGGMLDRIDSMLLVMPTALLYLTLCELWGN